MRHGEDIRMGIRWITGRPVETLLLVFGISLGIGATAAGVALAAGPVRKREDAPVHGVPRDRGPGAQSASEMDLPAILQTNTESVFLTTADLAAREDSQDVQYAYVANPTGFRFGAFDFRGPGGGPPPGEQAGAAAQGGQADAAKAAGDTAPGRSTEVFIAQGPSGTGDVMVYRQSTSSPPAGRRQARKPRAGSLASRDSRALGDRGRS